MVSWGILVLCAVLPGNVQEQIVGFNTHKGGKSTKGGTTHKKLFTFNRPTEMEQGMADRNLSITVKIWMVKECSRLEATLAWAPPDIITLRCRGLLPVTVVILSLPFTSSRVKQRLLQHQVSSHVSQMSHKTKSIWVSVRAALGILMIVLRVFVVHVAFAGACSAMRTMAATKKKTTPGKMNGSPTPVFVPAVTVIFIAVKKGMCCVRVVHVNAHTSKEKILVMNLMLGPRPAK